MATTDWNRFLQRYQHLFLRRLRDARRLCDDGFTFFVFDDEQKAFFPAFSFLRLA